MKNVTRISATHVGKKSWRLIDANGDTVVAFELFCCELARKGFAYSTRKRYAEVVANFIDYLYEVGVFGESVTLRKLNEAINIYPSLLNNGESRWVGRYAWVKDVIENLEITRASKKSFDNIIPAVNRFLRLSESLAQEERERASHLGINTQDASLKSLIQAINGSRVLSSVEKNRMCQNSVLGSVIRFNSKGMERPRGLNRPTHSPAQLDTYRLSFPLNDVGKLLDAACCYRDRAIWLLMASTGLRSSEVKNLQWNHVDFNNQRIWVFDPDDKRFGRQMKSEEMKRFKGRKFSMTYMIPSLRNEFFRVLSLYLKHEYIATKKHEFVFQCLRGKRRGYPILKMSDTGFIGNFKRAVIKAGIKGPPPDPSHIWTPHSLRHAYGTYMLNYIPNLGGFGLELEEVQMLMGHQNISSTKHYAQRDRDVLIAKLEAADRKIFQCELDDFRFDPYITGQTVPLMGATSESYNINSSLTARHTKRVSHSVAQE